MRIASFPIHLTAQPLSLDGRLSLWFNTLNAVSDCLLRRWNLKEASGSLMIQKKRLLFVEKNIDVRELFQTPLNKKTTKY